MRPDWYFNCGCLFDLGGWLVDINSERTPTEFLEDMCNGHKYGKLREEEKRLSEDDCDPVEDDLGGTELFSETVSENDTK